MSGDDLRLRAEMGDVEGLKLALGGGANPCSRDSMGLTALHYAVWNGHLGCAELLCANHLGVDEVAIEARKQKEEEERLAKEKAERKALKEAKKKAKNKGGAAAAAAAEAKPATPSSKFAQRKQQEAEALAAKAADEQRGLDIEIQEERVSCIDLQSSMGLTALHLAAMEAPDGPRIINLLLLCDCRTDLVDIEGCTALDRAKSTGRVQCEDAIAESTVTRAEKDSFRSYMESECKVQPQKERFAENPRLKGFTMPGRMPVMPRELEVPEQFTLPYAKTNFDAPRGREPLLNLGWADEEIQRNVGRRTMLATSKERQIERETGFSLEVSEVEQKRRDRLRKKQLEEEGKEAAAEAQAEEAGSRPATGGGGGGGGASKATEQTSLLTGDP